MEFRNEYLSDEELAVLIHEIEQNDLVMAPPDIRSNVLCRTVSKKREFVTYCFRVGTSVAAAIVILFLLPRVLEEQTFESKMPSREEVLAMQEYVSKEEALDETGFIQKIKRNIISAISMNENGGE